MQMIIEKLNNLAKIHYYLITQNGYEFLDSYNQVITEIVIKKIDDLEHIAKLCRKLKCIRNNNDQNSNYNNNHSQNNN